MRISSETTHADYHDQVHDCRVFLAGAERCNVLFADEQGRHAVTFRLDEFGSVVLQKGDLQRENFWGEVRIEAPIVVRLQRERIEAGQPIPPLYNFLWP